MSRKDPGVASPGIGHKGTGEEQTAGLQHTVGFVDSTLPVRHPFCRIARQRAQDYASVIKVVTELRNAYSSGRFAGSAEFPGPWYALRSFPVAASTEAEFAYGLNYLRSTGLFDPANRVRAVFKQASTLSCLVALAIRMQYRTIVLCGVDLNHSQYFYQDAALYPQTASLELSPHDTAHATNSPMPWRHNALNSAEREGRHEDSHSAMFPARSQTGRHRA